MDRERTKKRQYPIKEASIKITRKRTIEFPFKLALNLDMFRSRERTERVEFERTKEKRRRCFENQSVGFWSEHQTHCKNNKRKHYYYCSFMYYRFKINYSRKKSISCVLWFQNKRATDRDYGWKKVTSWCHITICPWWSYC